MNMELFEKFFKSMDTKLEERLAKVELNMKLDGISIHDLLQEVRMKLDGMSTAHSDFMNAAAMHMDLMQEVRVKLVGVSTTHSDFMDAAAKDFGQIDFLLHSIAFADRDDLTRDTVETSRAGFKLAMDVSVYSLISVTNAARSMLKPDSSVLTMTYFGGEKCVPGYNVMGICKAALDATVRYLAYDLGPQGIRVNGVSAGPLKTLAGVAAGVGEMQEYYDYVAPLGRCVTHEEVGRSGSYLLSSYSNGITGEILHVDSGYNIMGSPGRLLEQFRKGT